MKIPIFEEEEIKAKGHFFYINKSLRSGIIDSKYIYVKKLANNYPRFVKNDLVM